LKCNVCELRHAAGVTCAVAVADFLETQAIKLIEATGRMGEIRRTVGDWPKPEDFRARIDLARDRVKQLVARSEATHSGELAEYKRLVEELESKLSIYDSRHLSPPYRFARLRQAIDLLKSRDVAE
jgi:hypothetical protein